MLRADADGYLKVSDVSIELVKLQIWNWTTDYSDCTD